MNSSKPHDDATTPLLEDMDTPAPQPELLPIPDVTRGYFARLTLDHASPEIWRVLCLPGHLTLHQLNLVIQDSMGWKDYHLHRFSVHVDDEVRVFLTDFDISEGDIGVPESDVRLDQVITNPDDTLHYEYDFGDGWAHTLVIEDVRDRVPTKPFLLEGGLACPPEDCGGITGYAALARWVRSGYAPDDLPPQFRIEAEARAWLPDGWNPDEFDVESTARIVTVDYEIMTSPLPPLRAELAERLEALRASFRGENSYGAPMIQVVISSGAGEATNLSDEDAARLLAPFMAVVDVIGAGADLTRAGYLHPPLPRLIAEAAGITDFWIRPIASEYQAWPVLQLRQTAQALGLVTARKGRISATKVATTNRNNPAQLVKHVVGRLPLGKAAAERHAGWATLAAIINDVSVDKWDAHISELLFTMGWADETGMNEPDAGNATLDVFTIMARSLSGEGAPKGVYPALDELARLALHG